MRPLALAVPTKQMAECTMQCAETKDVTLAKPRFSFASPHTAVAVIGGKLQGKFSLFSSSAYN